MATAPVKPPLHNFSLSFLKWGSKNHTNTTHRFRRPLSAEPEPEPESASDDPDSSEPHHHRVGSRTLRHRFSLTPCSSEKEKKVHKQRENDEREREEAAEVQKPWNLRPRRAAAVLGLAAASGSKAVCTTAAAANGEVHEPEGPNPVQTEPKSMRLRGLAAAEGQCVEKKEKRKFWIALSKEEIEEDIFVMTGSRPSRRPNKRPKNVQKQLDSVFPGLWLVGFSADAYRAADIPAKR